MSIAQMLVLAQNQVSCEVSQLVLCERFAGPTSLSSVATLDKPIYANQNQRRYD